jgi:hypothetical protein
MTRGRLDYSDLRGVRSVTASSIFWAGVIRNRKFVLRLSGERSVTVRRNNT